MRRRAKPPPHPADPPTTTNRHTNAHLLSGTTTRLRGVKTVVEAGTANSAFAKGGRCPTVRQPLSTWAPALHRTDEPLVLCQPFLTPLIGRQRALSTPQSEKFLGLRSLPAGLALTPFRESGYCLLIEALERLGDIAEALRAHESLRMRLRDELGTAPSSQAQTLHGRLLRGGPVAAVETADVHPTKIPTSKRPRQPDHRLHYPAWRAVSRAARHKHMTHNQSRPGAASDSRLPRWLSQKGTPRLTAFAEIVQLPAPMRRRPRPATPQTRVPR